MPLKEIVKNIFSESILKIIRTVRNDYLNGCAINSYSQEGEDMVLRRFFEQKAVGFYVDVGAHHPKRFSNTCYFYENGWSGINIDAMAGSMKLFSKMRPRDTNVEIPVSSEENILTYYMFNEPALNGFDAHLSEKRDAASSPYKVKQKIDLQTRSLASIFNEFLPSNTKIDFLSIDVEGFDLDVLKSNDWDKYRPDMVLVEILGSSLDLNESDIVQFLTGHGYSAYAKTMNTVFFKLTQ